MQTAQAAPDKDGMVLRKDELSQNPDGERNSLNGVWIVGGIFALFIVLLLVLRKKRKNS